MKPLTPRQAEVLELIKANMSETGMPPAGTPVFGQTLPMVSVPGVAVGAGVAGQSLHGRSGSVAEQGGACPCAGREGPRTPESAHRHSARG